MQTRHIFLLSCFRLKQDVRPYKKAGLREGISFGSPAISILKIRGFPPPPCEGFGFIGQNVQGSSFAGYRIIETCFVNVPGTDFK